MKGINHLVLAARDLDALCTTWAELGFTLTRVASIRSAPATRSSSFTAATSNCFP